MDVEVKAEKRGIDETEEIVEDEFAGIDDRTAKAILSRISFLRPITAGTDEFQEHSTTKRRLPNLSDPDCPPPPLCFCGLDAVLLDVVKGRDRAAGAPTFYCCSKAAKEQCDFIEWEVADCSASIGSSATLAASPLPLSLPPPIPESYVPGYPPLCECGVACKQLEIASNRSNAVGKLFYVCRFEDADKCNFHLWEGEWRTQEWSRTQTPKARYIPASTVPPSSPERLTVANLTSPPNKPAGPPFEINMQIADFFETLSKLYQECGVTKDDNWRVYQYKKIAGKCRGFDLPLDLGHEKNLSMFSDMKGVGPKAIL